MIFLGLKNLRTIFHIYAILCFYIPLLFFYFLLGKLSLLSDLRIQLITLIIPALIAEYYYNLYDLDNLCKNHLKILQEELDKKKEQ
jgi:hypothetical protein